MEREPEQSPEEYLERLDATKTRRFRILLVLVASAILGSCVAYGPGWCVERAAKSYTACSNRDYEERPQSGTSCDSTAWLLFPKLVPWKRKAALEEEVSIERSVASRRFKLATSFEPDATARGKAADELARVYRRERDSSASPASEGLLSTFALAGDVESVRRHASVAKTPTGVNNVMRAFFAVGDLDGAIAYAKNPPTLEKEDYGSRDMLLTRGVLLCLASDAKGGGRALADAERVHAQFHTFPYYESRIARAACGERVEGGESDIDRDVLRTFHIGAGLKGKAIDELLFERWKLSASIGRSAASIFVAAALAEGERSLDDTVALVSAIDRVPVLGMTPIPWAAKMISVGMLTSEPVLLDPERHERAAERLEAMAEKAPEAEADEKALQKHADQLPLYTSDHYRVYRAKPKEVLGHFARGLWLEAASARAGLGDAAKTERDIERAQRLGNEAETIVFAAPMLMSIGRFEKARQLLEKGVALTSVDKTTRALVLAFLAQVFAHERRWNDALVKAQAALVEAEKLDGNVGEPIAVAIRWLVLALAFEKNDLSIAPPLQTPEIYARAPMTWTDFVASPDPDRATLRWRMRGVEVGSLPIALPAQIFVVGQAARGHDVEVWLDQQLGLFDKRLTGAPALRARAEAARMRGDDSAERAWLERAQALEKRFDNPKRRVLGSLLGL